MKSKRRRCEVLLPLQFNDGLDVAAGWIAEAVVGAFGAASYETQKVEAHWRRGGDRGIVRKVMRAEVRCVYNPPDAPPQACHVARQ